ncbi:MAG: hypothetical protein M1816_000510 [Peltula sp. TS41687]|nr:MAG: hypothetical protein M1816_000510 [Peltula sp. TS41687]
MPLTGRCRGLGTVLGPVVGGAFADSAATWRWAFYINLVIGALLAPAYLLLLPSVDFQAGRSLKEKLKMMDWIGIAIFFGGTTCFTMAINFGGTTYAWDSGPQITLWVMSGVLLLAMALVTIYHPFVAAKDKLYPAHFLKRLELVNLQLQLFLISGVTLTTAYYIPLYFQFTQGDSALRAAVRLLPFIVMLVFFTLVNGATMPKLGFYMPWYLFGSALALMGTSLMYTVNYNTSPSKIYGYTALMGIGAGCFVGASFAVVQALVAPEEIINAVGFMSVAQDMGIVVLLAIAGTIYQNIAIQKIQQVLPGTPGATVQAVITGTSNPAFQSLAENARIRVVIQITSAMRNVWALLMRKKIYMEAAPGGG